MRSGALCGSARRRRAGRKRQIPSIYSSWMVLVHAYRLRPVALWSRNAQRKPPIRLVLLDASEQGRVSPSPLSALIKRARSWRSSACTRWPPRRRGTLPWWRTTRSWRRRCPTASSARPYGRASLEALRPWPWAPACHAPLAPGAAYRRPRQPHEAAVLLVRRRDLRTAAAR